MNNVRPSANPFGLLVDPQSVLRAVESSATLQGLQRQVCRPLDRHLVVRPPGTAAPDGDEGGAEVADGEGDAPFGSPPSGAAPGDSAPWRI